jgi:peptide/nickel transport system permease protein
VTHDLPTDPPPAGETGHVDSAAGPPLTVAVQRGELNQFTVFTRSNRPFVIGLAIVAVSIFLMAFGPLLGTHNPTAEDFNATLTGPSGHHWFGTDQNGRDIFSRTIAAPRIDLYIALVSTFLAMALGVPLGVLATGTSRLGELVGEWMLRAMDVIQAFPVFILALALVAGFGPSAVNVIIALTVLQFPVFLRLTRGAALGVRGRTFVEAARIGGAGTGGVMLRHVLPNSIGPALVGASVSVAQAVLITAGLSFVGAGIRPPTPEWGAMISDGAQSLITGQWWPSVFPGVGLGIVVLGYALVGDGLRLYLDPSRRQ